MSFECFFQDCTVPPNYYCRCKKYLCFMCTDHLSQHISENNKNEHLIKAAYLTVSQEDKNLKLEQINKSLELMKDIESSVINELSSIIYSANLLQTDYINYFEEQEMFFEHLKASQEESDKIIIAPGYETQPFKAYSYICFLSGIYSNLNKNIQKVKENLEEFENTLKSLKDFSDSNELDFSNNANLDEHLYCFKTESKTLIEYNTLTYNIKKNIISINEIQGFNASICQIPRNRLFNSGGKPYNDRAYVIDLNTFTVEQLPKTRLRGYAVATYFENSVYIFGGHNGDEQLSIAEKFDLVNKRWINLESLPRKSHDIHVLPFETYFLMTLYTNDSMLKYSINDNFYQLLGESPKQASILFRDSKKIFLISSDILYLSNEENLNSWICVKSLSQALRQHTSKPITRKREVFMLSSSANKIWKFDLDALNLLLIGSIW